jgi:arylsulfatase
LDEAVLAFADTKVVQLRSDPFERAQHEAGDYVKWFVEHALFVPTQAVAEHLASFRQFPPRQAPGSFTVNQVIENLQRLSRNPPSTN